MKYKVRNHTFVICAYRESPYLEECILSLKSQTVKTKCMIVTSTDNSYIKGLAVKYGLPYFVNKESGKGIAADWNFALRKTTTELVTIAHQDDVYFPEFCEYVLKYANRAKQPLILFTDYSEKRNDKMVSQNSLLQIKRIMLLPLKLPGLWGNRFVRRRILSLGSPICCPSVTYVVENLPRTIFQAGYRSDLDWQAWECVSNLKGEFIYIPKNLMAHRIHAGSATSEIIADNDRSKEDYEMFCKFWPKWIAGIIGKVYKMCEKSNEI